MTSKCEGRLHERFPARPESITPLRQAVVEFAGSCGASERRCEDIALAVSEALSNAVMHAYAGRDGEGTVSVDAALRDEALEIVVGDDGGGMRARDDSPGLGLGLALIERMADELELEDARPGVRVRMTFSIG